MYLRLIRLYNSNNNNNNNRLIQRLIRVVQLYKPINNIYRSNNNKLIRSIHSNSMSTVASTGTAAVNAINSLTDSLSAPIDPSILEFHTVPINTPIAPLEIRSAFNSLTNREKQYLHHLSRACWNGSIICLFQTSIESPGIFDLFNSIFSKVYTTIPSNNNTNLQTPLLSNELIQQYRTAVESVGINSTEFDYFLQYIAQFYSNLGNYLSFGDSKFIPRLTADKFRLCIINSPFSNQSIQELTISIDALLGPIYSLLPAPIRTIGLPETGSISTYYSTNVTKADMDIAQSFIQSINSEAYNTRLFKTDSGVLQLRLAAATASPTVIHQFQGRTIELITGDYGLALSRVVNDLKQALNYTANSTQTAMIQHYITSFDTGSIDSHKSAQKEWVRDVGPVVESNIGFIESYRDPYGVRGEFEGFVSVVNKSQSAKFTALVDGAEQFLTKLPWPRVFEKTEFKRPDFTSLEVFTFASSGIPAGINIPNYDDIRQTVGFKNVSLGNVLSAKSNYEKFTFLLDSDQKYYNELKTAAFEVQVGVHELLGHGSGKVFQQDLEGKFNFPTEEINPITNKPLGQGSYYKPGETWDSKFLALSSPMEECRAECVGIYLSCNRDLLTVFNHTTDEDQDNIVYINWLHMARAGLLSLEMYSPEQTKWRQAHSQARYAILQCMLEAGQDFVKINTNPDYTEATIVLDRTKIETVGRTAIAAFLTKLQIYKSTADVQGGTELFNHYSNVNTEFLKLRELVLAKKQPRRQFVQANSIINNTNNTDSIDIIEYESTPAGIIHSNVMRFANIKANY